jgi:hypothetical protein
MIIVNTFFSIFCCHHFLGCKLENNVNKLYNTIIFKNFVLTFLSNNNIDKDFKYYARVYKVVIYKTHFDLTNDFPYEYFVTSIKLRIVTALLIHVINMTKCVFLIRV